MKKAVILTVILGLIIPCAYAGTMGEINDAVEKKMKQINSSGKSGQNVTEIKFQRMTPTPVGTSTITPERVGQIGTLSALNVAGGIFEGGIMGMTIGLIGYSGSMNRNIDPVIYGSLAGSIAGAVIGAGLSAAQAITGKYSMSDDFGLDILGGFTIGSVVGASAGIINWNSTGHLENVSEGCGWGALFGAIGGVCLAVFESFLPENIRGGSLFDGGVHASIIETGGTTMLAVNLKY